jgi:hypothetical protein
MLRLCPCFVLRACVCVCVYVFVCVCVWIVCLSANAYLRVSVCVPGERRKHAESTYQTKIHARTKLARSEAVDSREQAANS